MYRQLLIGIAALALSHCTALPVRAPGGGVTATTAAPEPVSLNSAVVGLVERAESLRQTGDVAGAEATMERALRIEPDNGHLWLGLARAVAAGGETDRAAALGRRALNLAAVNTPLRSAAEAFLAQL